MPSNMPNVKRIENSSLWNIVPQIIAVSVKNLLMFEFGLTLGLPTILIPSLSGKDPRERIRLDTEEISWISSLSLIWISVGCVVTGPTTNAFGRKRTMQFITIPFLISWFTLYFSTESWHIFTALSIIGFSGGLLEAPVITYVAEVTEPHIRGILTTVSSVTISVGFLVQFLLGSFLPWRQIVLTNTIVPIICLVSLFFIPETPTWLLAKNRPDEAKKNLAWLRGWKEPEAVEQEFGELWERIKEEQSVQKPTRIFDSISRREIYVPFLLISYALFLGYFTGTTCVTTYAISIFTTLKTPIDEYYATVILGLMQLLGGVFCSVFIYVLGKRVITFVSLLGIGVCFLTISVYIYINELLYLEDQKSDGDTKHWVPVILLVVASFIATSGIVNIPWCLVGEVFTNEARAKAAGVAAAVGYIFNFIANKLFLTMVGSMTLPGVFIFYALVALIGTIVLHFSLPETEGKTLHEISDHFKGKVRIDNKVKRRKNEMELQIN